MDIGNGMLQVFLGLGPDPNVAPPHTEPTENPAMVDHFANSTSPIQTGHQGAMVTVNLNNRIHNQTAPGQNTRMKPEEMVLNVKDLHDQTEADKKAAAERNQGPEDTKRAPHASPTQDEYVTLIRQQELTTMSSSKELAEMIETPIIAEPHASPTIDTSLDLNQVQELTTQESSKELAPPVDSPKIAAPHASPTLNELLQKYKDDAAALTSSAKLSKTSPKWTNDKFAKEVDFIFQSVAAGGFGNQFQTFLTAIDRYQRNVLPPNSEHSGITFITRPRLCLTSSNLRQNRVMMPLDTRNPQAMPFMIRCLLDTMFCNAPENINTVDNSPLINRRNPFFTPLCNGLAGINGWPDPVIQTLTTDGGFFSEDQTVAVGSDNLNKSYDLTLTFKDIQNGPLIAIFQYWYEYIRCVTRGDMIAYKDDIDAQRLNYTVSIYRFVLDPTRKYITKYAKATGCFPRTPPLGSMFNVDENETFVSASGKFSIPFVANKIEYNDFAILQDFRLLMQRYCPDIDGTNMDGTPKYHKLDMCPTHNYQGLPWIAPGAYGMELMFKAVPNPASEAINAFNPTRASHQFPSGKIIPCDFATEADINAAMNIKSPLAPTTLTFN